MSRLLKVRVGRRPDLPVDPPLAASWEAARDDSFAANSTGPLSTWYEANTGFEALGLAESDLLSIGSAPIVTPAWLSANATPEHIYYDDDAGRWVIYACKWPNMLRPQTANLLIKGCKAGPAGSLYGIHVESSSPFCTIEHVSGDGGETDASRLIFAQAPMTARYCKSVDYRSGFRILNASDQLWEYNYVPRVWMNSTSDHNTGFTMRSDGTGSCLRNRFYRNMSRDGSSSAFGVYPRAESPGKIADCEIVENVLDMIRANVQYCNNNGGDGVVENTDWIGNIFGNFSYTACGASKETTGFKSGGGTVSGNRRLDGTPVQ